MSAEPTPEPSPSGPESGAAEAALSDRRRPRAVYAVGSEPDPRFSMANERTALAWVRTALALVAGGVGLTSVARLAGLSRLLDAVAVVLCLVGALLAATAVVGWRRRELAMRLGGPLPAPAALAWLAVAVAAAALVLAGYVVAEIR